MRNRAVAIRTRFGHIEAAGPGRGQRTSIMRGALGGPRVLLRRLREVMAEPVSAQDRLDKVVVLIAANMMKSRHLHPR